MLEISVKAHETRRATASV